MNEWMKKIWHMYPREFYSVIKNSEITSLLKMKGTGDHHKLNEISLIHKDKYHMFSLTYTS
jgi:hypothetical protein